MGGKSKSVTVGYRYKLGMHLAVSRTAWDALRTFRAGGRVAWAGNQTESGQIYVNAPELFGGDKKEGGVQGYLDVMMGEPTQGVNDYLASKITGLMPAFRGFFSLVWRGGLVTSINPYLKPWLLEGTRILEGWGSGDCWYPETAPIPRPSSEEAPEAVTIAEPTDTFEYQFVTNALPPDIENPDFPTDGWLEGDGAFGFISSGNPFVPTWPIGTPWPIDTGLWVRKSFNIEKACTISIEGEIENSALVYVNGVLIQDTAPGNPNVPGDTIDCSATANAGTVEVMILALDDFEDFGDDDNTYLGVTITATPLSASLPDMNPAHIIYQLATDPDLEMAYPTADIDEVTFTAAADKFFEEELGLTLSWNRQTKIRDFLQIVLDHAGAVFYADPFTGKFVLKAIRDDYDPDTLDVYDEDDIVAVEDFQRPGFGEAVNQIIVRYRDRINHVEAATPPAQDLASIQAQGRVISETREYPGFSHAEIAQRIAMRDLKAASARLAKAKIRMKRSLWRGAPAGVIKVSWAKLGLVEVIFRIVEIDSGTLESGEILVTLVEDVFGLPSSTYTAEQPSGWEEPDNTPLPIEFQEAYELPYWDLARNLTAADLENVDDDAGYVAAAAARANGLQQSFDMHTRISPAPYAEAGNGIFAPSAVLASAMARSDTSLAYSGGLDLDAVELPCRVLIGTGRLAEWVEVIAIDTGGGTMDVNRGVLDTTPQEHDIGSRLFFVAEDNFAFDPTERATGEEVDVRLTASSGAGTSDIDQADEMPIVPDQRFARPYAPGKVLINGFEFPGALSGSLTVTWAHRDRLQQTAGYVTQDEDSIGPEAGTTYNAYAYDADDDALLDSDIGITGTSWSPSIVGTHNLRTEIEAQRAGLTSWQRQVREFSYVGIGARITEERAARITEGGVFRAIETEGTPPPAYTHTSTFTFSGTFNTSDQFLIRYNDGAIWQPDVFVDAAGKASLDDMAIDLAAQLTAAIGGDGIVERSGATVTVQTFGYAFYWFNNSGDAFGSLVTLAESAKPAQANVNSAAFMDLYENVAGVWQLSPTTSENYNIGGTATLQVQINPRTWAAYKTLFENADYSAFNFNWVESSAAGPPSGYWVGFDDFPADFNADPVLSLYGFTATTGGGLPGQTRSSIKMTAPGDYGLIMSPVNIATGNSHPSGYRPAGTVTADGTPAFPSGAKELWTVIFGFGNPIFDPPVGWNTPADANGIIFTITLDGVDYNYTGTALDLTNADIATAFAGVLPGTYAVTHWNYLGGLIEIERTTANVAFTADARCSYGIQLDVVSTP